MKNRRFALPLLATGISLMLIAASTRADDLAPLCDEFDNAATISNWQRIYQTEGWNANQLQSFDINGTQAGWMRMLPYTSTWYQDYRGELTYKNVSGDFVITTDVHATNRAGTGAPASQYSLGGIMVRTPRNITPATWTTGGENYVFLSLGASTTPGVYSFEVKTTTNSVSTLVTQAANVNEAEIQVARIGSAFIMLRRPAGGAWAVHRRYSRPDMPSALQTGLTVYTDWPTSSTYQPFAHNSTVITGGNPDLDARFDFVRYRRPAVPANLQGLDLTNPAQVSDAQLLGFLGDNADDPQTAVSISDVTVSESSSTASFTATLSAASANTVTVDYATADGTTNPATAGSDYTAQPTTTLTFAPGETTKTISVPITNDTLDEENETFFVNLSNAGNAVIADSQGVGTITDNDPISATLSINDVAVTEGNAGTVNATFTVTLSAASGKTVTVQYATGTPGSVPATADVDYVAVPLTTLTFAPGVTTMPVTVQVNGDTLDEIDERFAVNLSAASNATIADNQGFGTIADDDAAPSLRVNDVTVTEGNSGTVNATFAVTLSAPSGKTVTVQYNTATPGSIPATAGADYVAVTTTTLTFAPGVTTLPVTVLVNGDLLDEDTERFTVNLKNTGNATLADKEGFCTITDDDAAPSLSINDVTLAEGNSGTTAFTFNVTLLAPSGKTVSVKYQTTSPGSLIATPGTDYTALPLTTLTFAPGQTSKTVTVLVNGDTQVEGTERFVVKLSSSANATISDSEGFGTITNDDAAPLLFEEDAPSE